MLSMIVAHDENRAIGRQGGMPWHIPEDLRFFRMTTMGKTVIMGRATWQSIGEKHLPGRRNIVVTSQPDRFRSAGAEFVSIAEVMDLISASQEEVFCIGGGRLYRQLVPEASKLYITRVAMRAESADTWFPEIKGEDWDLIAEKDLNAVSEKAITLEFHRR